MFYYLVRNEEKFLPVDLTPTEGGEVECYSCVRVAGFLLPVTGDWQQETRNYSDLKLFTGLASAALIA